ncbi:uncharacterized protein LOC108957437 [Eucalyptus grandis]|uniref:uncharacterized protein LOC108957437 n=1 Tax=Eucalyptus grandis TaxID=71139 RepID=UPI00192E95C7|nr:uncharacterized protein LOC108957437 [Eucalyptus grandis]
MERTREVFGRLGVHSLGSSVRLCSQFITFEAALFGFNPPSQAPIPGVRCSSDVLLLVSPPIVAPSPTSENTKQDQAWESKQEIIYRVHDTFLTWDFNYLLKKIIDCC